MGEAVKGAARRTDLIGAVMQDSLSWLTSVSRYKM